MADGAYAPMRSRNDILAYARASASERVVILANLADTPRRWPDRLAGTVLLSSGLERKPGFPLDGDVLLQAHEGVVVKVAS